MNYGGFLFFDATYGEFYLSVSGGSGDLVNTSTTTGLGAPITQDPSYPKTATSSLGIGLLGKYPFQLQKFTLFPLAGIEYQVFFTGAYKDDYTTDAIETKASDFNTLWFRAGGGVDYALTESLYIRLEGLYGFKLAPTEFDKNSENYVEGGGPLPSMGATGTGGDVKSGWVNTVTLKLGVGYKF
ncbi:hypothetical protein FACS1894163_02790 [Spirochaetia bacterium]|nr:hypothetical protein FACS1894163_02790 [Spirochaetia bacterium]